MIKNLILFILLFLASYFSFSQEKIKTDWLFIYYMPYDNNLSDLGDTIIAMIKDSITSDKVVAVVQADFSDSLGMKRFIITKDTIIITSLVTEYSANTQTYKDYLAWVTENFELKKSVVIFLNHGGKLDELCLDQYPQKKYLRVDSVKTVLQEFNQRQNEKIDLLFLQVCSKGSIEPLYELREVAKYTLASQTRLGAPNYYYHGLFKELSRDTNVEGLDIAKIMIDNETSDMYNSYTCVDNSKFEEFGLRMKYLHSTVEHKDTIYLKSRPQYEFYGGEQYWDLISFLEILEFDTEENRKYTENLIYFVKKELITIHKINANRSKRMIRYNGLSLLAKANLYTENVEKYKHLTFFQLFRFNKIILKTT